MEFLYHKNVYFYTIKTFIFMFCFLVLDMKCCICLALGLLLFLKAPYLSKSVTFYYTSSTAVGILASALVLIFIVSRLIPKVTASFNDLRLFYGFISMLVFSIYMTELL